MSGFRTFKDYYLKYVCQHLKREFPGLTSYNRFVELMQGALIPLIIFLKRCRFGKNTGISFIDSTTLSVCHNRRIYRHKTFKDIAQRGKTSMGWFYGFKLHIVVNEKGELLSTALTPGNVDDRKQSLMKKLTRNIVGKLFGDRGYIGRPLFNFLWQRGIQLITKLKTNMANRLMPLIDKLLLRKRAIIETINDELKNMCQIEHSRHRSPINFLVNLFSGLVAYTFFPKKPCLRYAEVYKLEFLG
jgi:transposase